ncbi:hypothetical protein LTR09_001593 [Extremus antarcticus]|uniref:Uncharacterized protein n=1 Tax=Extremus antarcticus TaxID=702011 RepID=A0AAJ0GH29_9PEZI|nr:hypothetical protein LTR09_001593 [Extremus antarcticus]
MASTISEVNSTAASPKGLLQILPPALRNIIYREVLVSANTRIDFSKAEIHAQTALLRTCRRTRSEATEIFLAENKFLLRVGDTEGSHGILAWIRLMGEEHASWSRTLTVGKSGGLWEAERYRKSS